MFLIIGTNPVKRSGNQVIRRQCPRCNDIRNFQEFHLRQFLSFFFIPIIPVSRINHFFTCPSCSYTISSDVAYETLITEADSKTENASDQVIILCPRCDGAMKVPLRQRRQELCCPHCSMEFKLKGIKGKIPPAMIATKTQPSET